MRTITFVRNGIQVDIPLLDDKEEGNVYLNVGRGYIKLTDDISKFSPILKLAVMIENKLWYPEVNNTTSI